MREILFDKEYFLDRIKSLTEYIAEDENDSINELQSYEKPEMLFFSIFKYHYQRFISLYSSGEKISGLKVKLENVYDAYSNYINFNASIKTDFYELEEYELCLWLVSWGILLKVNDQQFKRLLDCIGNEGEDELFEALVATRIKGRKTAKKLIYLKEYHLLLDATKGAHNGINIQQFLLSWYGNMKDCYWYDNHKGKDGGGFFGYWCWEAAAVAVAFNIDDTRFRDIKYYPKDMADFARAKANG